MNDNIYKKKAIKRLLFVLLVTLVYIVGSNISLPGVDTRVFMNLMNASPNMSFVLSLTGLSLDKFSLFSIGLGPWMSTLILWRVLSTAKVFHLESLTVTQAYLIKFSLALSFGVVQSLGILSQMGPLSPEKSLPKGILVLFLITGLSVVIWLGNMNKIYGYGGPSIIILINIIRPWPARIIDQFSAMPVTLGNLLKLVFISSAVLLILFGIFRFFQGERRLPLAHVLLDRSYASLSYLPIPTNPAGGMPYMYAFSIFLLPQYFLSLFGGTHSSNGIIRFLSNNFQTTHVLGVLILVITIIILTYGFAYVNVDYKAIAENMRNNGDYFPNVYPGKNTERYLFHKVTLMSTVSAFFNSMTLGVPMLIALIWTNIGVWAQLLPTLIIFMILIKEIYMQFVQAYHRNDYRAFVQGEALYR